MSVLENREGKRDIQIDNEDPTANGQIKPHSLWQSLKFRVMNTEAYQIFVVRPKGNHRSIQIYRLIGILFFIGYLSFTEVIAPPLKRDELKTEQGIFENLKPKGRRSGEKIYIRNDKGERIRFIAHLPAYERDSLKGLKGERITVYYRYSIHPFLFRYKLIKAVKHSNDFIKDYDQGQYEGEMQFYRYAKATMFSCLGGMLISFFWIYKINRKK